MTPLIAGVLALLAACNDSPTDPEDGPLLPDFDCQEVRLCALTCSDRTTGGKRPYQLFWQADEQAPTSVINPTFTWIFEDLELVRVRLSVTDDAGNGTTKGPVEKAFEVCDPGKATDAAGEVSTTPIRADFGWYRQGLRVEFVNSSEGAQRFHWDFGDGGVGSTQRDPVHIYSTPGSYRVRLLACHSNDSDATDCVHFEDTFAVR